MDARQEFMKVAEIVQELRIGRGRAYATNYWPPMEPSQR